MTPTTYGRDFAYCLKSHGGVRGFNASLWRFLLRCTLFCHSVATFLTSVSSYEGGCGFEVKEIISEETPLIGIEPSCILAFRDEYPDLVNENTREDARRLAANCLLYDEFIVKEIHKGNITQEQFTDFPLHIKLHGHCHQKSLASIEPSKEILALPENYQVDIIPSGCCGMAGAFGYEKEHYALSMQIGEQSLFPAVRQAETEICISAPGTSCRQQIKDGTGRQAYHPIEILYDALL